MNKKWKAIARRALLAAVSLALGVNLYLWNARRLLGVPLPMPFGWGAAVVLTGSMEPAIPADSLILVRDCDDWETGDVVVYQSGSMLVVHRVIAVDGDEVTTQGDANNAPDAPVSRTQIRGQVVGQIPGAGAAVRLLKTPGVTLVLAAAAVWMAEASFRKERQKDMDELEQIKEEIRKLKEEL